MRPALRFPKTTGRLVRIADSGFGAYLISAKLAARKLPFLPAPAILWSCVSCYGWLLAASFPGGRESSSSRFATGFALAHR